MKANVKYLDMAKIIQAFPQALAPFSNHMGDSFWCSDSQLKWNLDMPGQAWGQTWSEKAALKMDSNISHGIQMRKYKALFQREAPNLKPRV